MNHISAQQEHSPPLLQQSPARSHEYWKTDVISSQKEGLFTIQLGSLEPVLIPLMVQISMVETNLIRNDDKEGWTAITRRKLVKPK